MTSTPILLPNLISLLRIPLAFFLLSEDVFYRVFAIFLAMATDFLDGYLARRLNQTSRLGTLLDPIADKFFVIFGLLIFIYQDNLTVWEALALLSRDMALLCFGCYLWITNRWSGFRFQSIKSGKVTTCFQFFLFLCLVFKIPIPPSVYWAFIFLGICAFIELCWIEKQASNSSCV